MTIKTTLRERTRALMQETMALYLAARDPRTPWYARLLVAVIIAYVLSPIDLIPDFIPVIGYLDDLLLVPLGILLALRLIPAEVLADCRARANATQQVKPVSRTAAAVIIILWLLLIYLLGNWLYRAMMAN